MELLKEACAKLIAAVRGSRNFDADQRVAVRMFAAILEHTESASVISTEYAILKGLLNRRLSLINDHERAVIKKLFAAWNSAVAADLQPPVPDAAGTVS
jgi:hypothetical protein